jgi:MFS transporter, SET family, sugar efflux transporter
VSSPLFRPIALGLYLLFFTAGVVGALVLPTFSLFLAKEIGVRPLLVGLAFAGIALASIAYNHWLGIGRISCQIAAPSLLVVACLGLLPA